MKAEIKYFLIGVAIMFALAAVAGAVYAIVTHTRKKLVEHTSRKLQRVKELKTEYGFYPVKSEYSLSFNCKSKSQFDRTTLLDFLRTRIADNMDHYKSLIQCTLANRERMASFEKWYAEIVDNDSLQDTDHYTKYKFFRNVERKLCDRSKPDPITEFTIHAKKYYESPQGRNFYKSEYTFSMDDVVACYKREMDNIKRRETAQYQRSLMTDSLRYDVMKRDGFRCGICGASSKNDGVTLQVDHILPVSKGGKTEMSNLRTLCDRCNLGKGAKYDPDGLN